jgi:hypothetical protein
MKLRLILISVLAISLPTSPSQAADCTSACVDVYTQNGEIVIEARKGSGPSAAKVTKPKVVAKPKTIAKPKAFVKPKAIVKPKPVLKPKVAAPIKKALQKPVKKAAAKAVAATSLSDRLSKSLPTAGISYQPNPFISGTTYLQFFAHKLI